MKHNLSRKLIKDILIGVMLGVLLGAVLAALGYAPASTQAGQPFTVQDIAAANGTVSVPLTTKSSPADVLALMRQSYQNWQTFDGVATTIFRDEQTGKEILSMDRVQVEQFGKIRVETGSADASPSRIFVSTGTTIFEEDLSRGIYTEYPVPADLQSLEKWGPPAAPGGTDRFVVPHPMEGLIPSVVGGYIYPIGLGQSMRPEEVTVVGEDTVAARKTVAILWQVQDAGTIYKKHRYWIDAQTGLILKVELYGNSKSDWDFMAAQTTFVSAQYDQPVKAQTFVFTPAEKVQRIAQEQYYERQSEPAH